ncbi:DinB family protein [Bacillus sp. 165]|uniref:DinB family protein n=1 Tax=Bacillus sp. 165 TaxID=1529117 RepID=UPI001AD99FB4|nr:DinB family protein [Bacillus sp. 165]
MKDIIARLSYLMEAVPARLALCSEEELSIRSAPNKWSKKEILGHLCDSAVNNLTRFIKAQIEKPISFVHKYEQEQWVLLQKHQEARVEEMLQLWLSLNKAVIRTILNIPEDKYSSICKLYNGDTVTLKWLIIDYVEHMEHHLKQMGLEV